MSPGRRHSRIARTELVLAPGDHPAIGVRDHHQALDVEQVPRDHERRQDVVGDARAGIADDLRVAGLEPQHRERVDPRVDAGQHREPTGRAPVEVPAGEKSCAYAAFALSTSANWSPSVTAPSCRTSASHGGQRRRRGARQPRLGRVHADAVVLAGRQERERNILLRSPGWPAIRAATSPKQPDRFGRGGASRAGAFRLS